MDLLEDDKLTCKEMAEKLKTNTWIVQQSLQRLMRWGYIDRRPSKDFRHNGSFVYFKVKP